jgi:hypothetical protein
MDGILGDPETADTLGVGWLVMARAHPVIGECMASLVRQWGYSNPVGTNGFLLHRHSASNPPIFEPSRVEQVQV